MRYLREGKGVGSRRLASYWGKLAELYDDSTLLAGGTYPPIIEKLRGEFHPEEKLLDVGAGTGSLTVHIAPLVGHVTCTDIAPGMIERAKVRLHNFDHVAYGVEDARALCFENDSFDVVLCCNVLHQLSRPERAVSEFRRVLRPGGKLLAITLCMGHMSVWAKLRTAVEYVVRFGVPPAGSPFTLSSFTRLIAEAGFDVREAVLVTEKPFPTSYVSASKPQH
jgi:ubiquinone/menaquinone biosynthesis C-methylase UbiE